MKISTFSLMVAAGCAALVSQTPAADEKATPKEEKKSMRVISSPDRRVFVSRDKLEKETVAFLGVETNPVSATVSAQLGLTRGTGLAVNHVVAKSPAEGVLKEHDILLQLDDQILIETRQLSVLVRSKKEGDEVTLTYLRGGQKATAKVKLGKNEVPKLTLQGFPRMPFPEAGQFDVLTLGRVADREEVDGMLSMIQRSKSGEPFRVQFDHDAGPGFRAVTIQSGNSTMVFSDDDGSLELTNKEGTKSLVATNAKGEQLFSGPVTTPEDRKALPDAVRERLEKLEGMRDVTFRTDADFQGAETKLARPRGIIFQRDGGAPRIEIRRAFF